MCVYIYIYTYMHIYMYIFSYNVYVHTHTSIVEDCGPCVLLQFLCATHPAVRCCTPASPRKTHVRIYICVCMYMYICAYMCMYIHTYSYIYMFIYMHSSSGTAMPVWCSCRGRVLHPCALPQNTHIYMCM